MLNSGVIFSIMTVREAAITPSLRKISRSVSDGESQNLMFYLCLWPWWW